MGGETNKQKKAGNYWSPAVICKPENLERNFYLQRVSWIPNYSREYVTLANDFNTGI